MFCIREPIHLRENFKLKILSASVELDLDSEIKREQVRPTLNGQKVTSSYDEFCGLII